MDAESYTDSGKDLSITGSFPTGSAGEITREGDGRYSVLPKPEPVPDWFFEALQVNFGGAGVPREYAFHVRVRSGRRQTVRLVFPFTQTNGAGYMDPPYWFLREGRWATVADTDVDFVPRDRCEITLRLEAGETVQVANKPYLTPDGVEGELADLARMYPFLTVVEIGRTAEGRPILALETEPRDESILVNATMQPAEPAARPILDLAHAFGDRSRRIDRLLDRFQFQLIPMPNPDGSFHGRSVTNGRGEVPMFSFGRHLDGEDAPVETAAFWSYAERTRPVGHIEFHTHYQDTRYHKLNPVAAEWFDEQTRPRAKAAYDALLSVNDHWRLTALEKSTPIVTAGKFVNLASRLQTVGCCYQVYALTEMATASQVIAATCAFAEGLAGVAWRNEPAQLEIIPG